MFIYVYVYYIIKGTKINYNKAILNYLNFAKV